MSKENPVPESREAEAKRILDRVQRDSETVGTSSTARVSDGYGKTGRPEVEEDAIEVLGRKIGRSLGWIALIILAVYLLRTYIF